jgi:hypothetical protein
MATAVSFHILAKSFLNNHPIILRYRILAADNIIK